MKEPADEGKGSFVFMVQAIGQSLTVRRDYNAPNYRESSTTENKSS
jgi:hypothetical protein